MRIRKFGIILHQGATVRPLVRIPNRNAKHNGGRHALLTLQLWGLEALVFLIASTRLLQPDSVESK
jgi:hypothetical protein